MAAGFGSYEIARSGLVVSERGLNVTGHNISNVNTPGYVRQQAIIEAGPYQQVPSKYGTYDIGLGAGIQEVRQIRHVFLDNIYRKESTSLGYWEARSKTLNEIQTILGEPMEDGLQSVMNQFWDSWQELSKDPDSLTTRALVHQRGEALVYYVNHLGQQLDKLQDDLNKEIEVKIHDINRITERIAKLNTVIMENEVTGDSANDYRDERNILVDQLSKLIDADVTEMQDSQLTITLGGYVLVDKGRQTALVAAQTEQSGLFFVPRLAGTDIDVPVKGGILKGLLESRGEVKGDKGSVENGSPSTKADVVFAIDISNTSASYLADVKANISKCVEEMKKKGIDYNLRLITYGDTTYSNTNFGTDESLLASAIPGVPLGDTGNNFGGVGGVLEALQGISDFRENASRQLIVFSQESIEGDSGTDVTDVANHVQILKGMGISTSVVTDKNNYFMGESAGEVGWNSITSATGGELLDINSGDYTELMNSIGGIVNKDVSYNLIDGIGSNNIIPDLKRQLNAMINVMVREINSLQRSGKTLDGNDGGDFFTAIDPDYPLQIGNIKIADGIVDLNGIVASESGMKGDNAIALKIANLRYDVVMGKSSEAVSIDDYYRSIILDIGNKGDQAMSIVDSQIILVNSAENSRQAIMGVSMDEEMTHMMKYKFAYDASSRALNVIDQMIETIITRMGVVGR